MMVVGGLTQPNPPAILPEYSVGGLPKNPSSAVLEE